MILTRHRKSALQLIGRRRVIVHELGHNREISHRFDDFCSDVHVLHEDHPSYLELLST